MKAPHYMRADLIWEVTSAAVSETSDPIDRIDVGQRTVDVFTEKEILTFSADLGHSVDERGVPLLGSDYWTVALIRRRSRSSGWLAGLLGLGQRK